MHECVVWLKSIETFGSLSYANTFTISLFAACSTTELTSSTVTGLLASNVKSTALTLGVGTLNAVPSNFPCSSGKTSPNARAAQVEVGIIEEVADLALYRSSCLLSNVG